MDKDHGVSAEEIVELVRRSDEDPPKLSFLAVIDNLSGRRRSVLVKEIDPDTQVVSYWFNPQPPEIRKPQNKTINTYNDPLVFNSNGTHIPDTVQYYPPLWQVDINMGIAVYQSNEET